MIKKLLSVLMSLSLGSGVEALEEENFFIVEDINKVSFELSLIFPDKQILILSHMEKDWKPRLEKISKVQLSKLQGYSWSMYNHEGKDREAVFSLVEVDDISEYFSAFIAAMLMGDYGEYRLSGFNKDFGLGIKQIKGHEFILYNAQDFHSKTLKNIHAYRLDSENLLEILVHFTEKLEAIQNKIEETAGARYTKKEILNKLEEVQTQSLQEIEKIILLLNKKEMQSIPLFETLVRDNLSSFSDKVLLKLIKLSFKNQSATKEFPFTPLLIADVKQRDSLFLQSAMVSYFLNAQACYMQGSCQKVSPIHKRFIEEYFYTFKKDALGRLLLGINLRLSAEVYHRENIYELFYAYLESVESEEMAKKVIKRFKSHVSPLIKDTFSEDEFVYMTKKLSNKNLHKGIKKELNHLVLELKEIRDDYHTDKTASINKAVFLPDGITKLIDVSEVKQYMTFKRKGQANIVFNLATESWSFTMNQKKSNESFLRKLNSAELMFPQEVYFTMEFDGLTFVKDLRTKDFLNFIRSLQTGNLDINSQRVVSTGNSEFAFGFSRLDEKYMIIYNAKSHRDVAYRIAMINYPNAEYGISYFRRVLLSNKDGRLFDNDPDKQQILATVRNYQNESLTKLEDIILSIKYIESTFSGVLKTASKEDIEALINSVSRISGEAKNFEEELKNTFLDTKIEVIKPFDEMIKNKISMFSDETLKHLIDLSFFSSNATDSYYFSFLIAQELTKRNSLSLQKYFAQAFLSSFTGPTNVGKNLTFRSSLYNFYFSLFIEEVIIDVLLGVNKFEMSTKIQRSTAGYLLYDYLQKAKDLKGAKKVMRRFKFYLFERIANSHADHMEFNDYVWDKNNEFDHQIAYATLSTLMNNNNSKAVETLLKVFTADILHASRKGREDDIQAAEKLLRRMIDKMDDEEILEIQIYNNVLTQRTRRIDYKKISFSLFYKLFHKLMSSKSKLFYSNRDATFRILAEYDLMELESRMLEDMQNSSVFKENTLAIFKFYSEGPRGYDDSFYEFMAVVKGVNAGESRELALKNEREYAHYLELEELKKEKKDKLFTLNWHFKQAMQYKKEDEQEGEENKLDVFIRFSSELAKEKNYAKEYAYEFADFTTKLLIKRMEKRDLFNAKKILESYISNVIPYIGLDIKSEDVASNGLVIAILTKDDILAKKIFNKVLGKGFDVNKTNNEFLLFNLSCYYATHNEKSKMLVSIKQALLHGKTPEEFMTDGDFISYLNDKDFLELLKSPSLEN